MLVAVLHSLSANANGISPIYASSGINAKTFYKKSKCCLHGIVVNDKLLIHMLESP